MPVQSDRSLEAVKPALEKYLFEDADVTSYFNLNCFSIVAPSNQYVSIIWLNFNCA